MAVQGRLPQNQGLLHVPGLANIEEGKSDKRPRFSLRSSATNRCAGAIALTRPGVAPWRNWTFRQWAPIV